MMPFAFYALNAFYVFLVRYLFWFGLVFFALKVPSKPVRMSKAFYAFLFVGGPASFATLFVALKLLG